mmetsp:Transcript_5018/g.7752  ORF Transcript_5018/g.7752 Transcript_5018/m.7752 type:complete len:167 (+) Transcript_5018:58-558(+)
MGCSCSASSAVNLSIERQCSMMFLRLTTQLATDEFGRARDMKKFIFGRKIIVQSVLIDVWILYMGENNQASEMPKNVFKEIFGCYVSAVVKYLSQWVRNMLVLSMKSLNLNLSENDIWDIFNDCKRYIDCIPLNPFFVLSPFSYYMILICIRLVMSSVLTIYRFFS